jgi:AmmeMemoRadiSam system protein B
MAETLPRLRMDLDFLPSPVPDRPGLMIRDPYRYSDATLIVPPALVGCLQCFDGRQTELDLRSALVELTGDLKVSELERHLRQTLSQAGFFDDDVYRRLRDAQHAAFARAARREPSHAGAAYPDDAPALRAKIEEFLADAQGPGTAKLAGIAAPHVSPEGGRRCYGAAYAALGPEYGERVFVVLGTSHYGEPERFGLTRKPFVTPLGETQTDAALVGRLAAAGGPAVKMEDYCHAVEHSIEFQVIFLQHRFGPGVRIVPILCGPFAQALEGRAKPDSDPAVRQFLDALGDLAAREGERLFWVLGIDMAHMGRRYGDPFAVRAHTGRMAGVEEADRERIELAAAGDADGFWAAVGRDGDPLKWCGSAALFTFLRAAPLARGELLDYRQWNIDEQSAVTFGAIAFQTAP